MQEEGLIMDTLLPSTGPEPDDPTPEELAARYLEVQRAGRQRNVSVGLSRRTWKCPKRMPI